MSEIITRPIGSHFNCNGVELVVVENTLGIEGYCGPEEDPCFFAGCLCTWKEICGSCSKLSRNDGRDVYFKEVKS